MSFNEAGLPIKEIDLELLVFVERYVTNLLKWDLLTFFGNHPNERKSVPEMAQHVGRSDKSVRSELGDLAILELLQKSNGDGQPIYQLTLNTVLRPQVIKFAKNRVNRNTISQRVP